MGSPCKLPRPSGALPPGLGGFRSATAGGSTGRGVTIGRCAEQQTRGPRCSVTRWAARGPGRKERRALHSRALQGGNETGHPLCPRRPPAGAPRPPSPGRGSRLRALRQMLHNSDPPPPLCEMAWSPRCSAKWAGAHGSAAERGGPGRGGSRIPDVAGKERGVQTLARRLPAPRPRPPPPPHPRPQPARSLSSKRCRARGGPGQSSRGGSPKRPSRKSRAAWTDVGGGCA